MGPHRDILHIDGNNSTVAVPHLERHDIGVEEHSDILGSIRKIDQGEIWVQAGEDIYTKSQNLAGGGVSYLDVRRGRDVNEVKDF